MTRLLAAAAVAVLGLGCGGGGDLPTAVVRGKVTYKGKPVPTGTVTFVPTAPGPSATGAIGPDGTFRLTTYADGDGAVLGPHKVIVVAMQDMGDRMPEDRSPLPPPVVPVRYTSLATTDLTFEVKAGENDATFDLTEKK